jgi:hypothetical protein
MLSVTVGQKSTTSSDPESQTHHYGWKRTPQGVLTRQNRSIKLDDTVIELTSSVFIADSPFHDQMDYRNIWTAGWQRTWLNINEMGLCHVRYTVHSSTIAVSTLLCNKGWSTIDQVTLETKKKFHDMESPTISHNKEFQSEVIIEEVRGNCLCNH